MTLAVGHLLGVDGHHPIGLQHHPGWLGAEHGAHSWHHEVEEAWGSGCCLDVGGEPQPDTPALAAR